MNTPDPEDDELRPEYRRSDFPEGLARGKYATKPSPATDCNTSEDEEDAAAFEERKLETPISYEQLLEQLAEPTPDA